MTTTADQLLGSSAARRQVASASLRPPTSCWLPPSTLRSTGSEPPARGGRSRHRRPRCGSYTREKGYNEDGIAILNRWWEEP